MKNNSFKLARFTVQSILAGADNMKVGFISRANPLDPYRHVIMGTSWFKPKELATQMADQGSVYVLDEPTTGLHFDDTRKLLEVLQRLVDQGNTVVVIEHNLDVIKTADWIIDIGPEGGDGGGRIVAEGTPEDVAQVAESHTGRYLAPMLDVAEQRRAAAVAPKAKRTRVSAA